MADIIKFPSDKTQVATIGFTLKTEMAPAVPPPPDGIIRSFICAMGSTTDPTQIRNDILHRQGKLLEQWVYESVDHLGTAAVLEMVESMALHLRKDLDLR